MINYGNNSNNNNRCYLKPVIVLAPDFIPGYIPTCPGCSRTLYGNGWATNSRYIHGLRHGYFILQNILCARIITAKLKKLIHYAFIKKEHFQNI